jgi:hypothetical protein
LGILKLVRKFSQAQLLLELVDLRLWDRDFEGFWGSHYFEYLERNSGAECGGKDKLKDICGGPEVSMYDVEMRDEQREGKRTDEAEIERGCRAIVDA